MHIYKRDSFWWIEGTDAYGKRIRKTTHTKDRTEATKILKSLKMATAAKDFRTAVEFLRLYYRDEGTPLDMAWQRYEEIARSTGRDNVTERTAKMRCERVARLVAWLKTERPKVRTVEDVTGPVAAGFATHLSDIGLSPKTRVNIIGDLSTVWRSLEKVSPDIRNPWGDLTPRTNGSERFSAFTEDEERRVFEAARAAGKGWYLACLIAADTGLRYGDVATLKWTDVHLDERVIRLTPQKTKRHRIAVVAPLSDRLFNALSAAKESASEVYVLPEHAIVHSKTSGASFRALAFSKVLEAAGIKGDGYTFHSWRHTFRTRLAAAGVSTEVAMRLCGHTDRTTSARYDHDEHLPELRAAVDAVSRK